MLTEAKQFMMMLQLGVVFVSLLNRGILIEIVRQGNAIEFFGQFQVPLSDQKRCPFRISLSGENTFLVAPGSCVD